jgi:acyl dehydratase
MMKNYRWLACAGAILMVATTAGAGQQPAAKLVKFTAPVRGEAQMGFTKPVTKRTGKEITTVITVKNLSDKLALVGLKVDEFWYDKAGNPITGDQYRHRKPIQPGEMIDVTLHTPVIPKMDRNQYKFEHANGSIKAVPMNAKGEVTGS